MIHHGLPFGDYLGLPGWNWSLIKLLEHGSPRHVQHAARTPDHETASRGLLRAVHTLVLEPDTFGAAYSVYRGSVRRGKDYEAHCACYPGTTVLNAREYDLARATAEAVLAHPAARQLLEADGGKPEVSITWTDEATGLPCKGRLDWLSTVAFVDLKTLGTTNERSVARLVAQNLYHGQLAHYDDGLRAHGIELPAFIIVAEGRGAQDVAVFEIDEGIPDGSLHVGRELRKRLMTRLAECVGLDHWPGRQPEPLPLCLPAYALLDDAESITFGDASIEAEGGL